MDEIFEALRAAAEGDPERAAQRVRQIPYGRGIGTVLNAASYVVTNRRFRDRPASEVQAWATAAFLNASDAHAAQDVITAQVRQASTYPMIGDEQIARIQAGIVTRLLAEEVLQPEEVDEFLGRVRQLTGVWTDLATPSDASTDEGAGSTM